MIGSLLFVVSKPNPILDKSGQIQWDYVAVSPSLKGAQQAVLDNKLSEYIIQMTVTIDGNFSPKLTEQMQHMISQAQQDTALANGLTKKPH